MNAAAPLDFNSALADFIKQRKAMTTMGYYLIGVSTLDPDTVKSFYGDDVRLFSVSDQESSYRNTYVFSKGVRFSHLKSKAAYEMAGELVDSLELQAAKGEDLPRDNAHLQYLTRLMDRSPWTFWPDYGIVSAHNVNTRIGLFASLALIAYCHPNENLRRPAEMLLKRTGQNPLDTSYRINLFAGYPVGLYTEHEWTRLPAPDKGVNRVVWSDLDTVDSYLSFLGYQDPSVVTEWLSPESDTLLYPMLKALLARLDIEYLFSEDLNLVAERLDILISNLADGADGLKERGGDLAVLRRWVDESKVLNTDLFQVK